MSLSSTICSMFGIKKSFLWITMRACPSSYLRTMSVSVISVGTDSSPSSSSKSLSSSNSLPVAICSSSYAAQPPGPPSPTNPYLCYPWDSSVSTLPTLRLANGRVARARSTRSRPHGWAVLSCRGRPRSGRPRRPRFPYEHSEAAARLRGVRQLLQQAQVALRQAGFARGRGDRDHQDIVEDGFESAGL